MSWLVLTLAIGLTVAGSLVTRSVVQDQDKRLLKERVEEANLILTSAVGSLTVQLNALAVEASLTGYDAAKFDQFGGQLTGLYRDVSLVRLGSSGAQVVASVGKQPLAPGTVLSGPPADVLSQARAAADAARQAKKPPIAMLTTPVFGSDGARVYGIAYLNDLAAPGYAVYIDQGVSPLPEKTPKPSSAFREIAVAVYAGTKVDPAQFVLAGNAGRDDIPLRGHTALTKLKIGASDWLLVGKARQSLVGSVAELTPWGILIGGLLASLLIAWTVEVLARRRRYALDLVDERTAELQASLTELSATQQQLVRSERLAAIGELASTVGHELRNPLGVLSNALYLIRADLGPDASDRAQRHLATADREVSAASLIVSDLLEFARAREPAPVEFDVDELVDEVLTVSPPPSGITVERTKPEHPVTISADRDQMRQVVLNLVGNAEQAMDDGGTLRLGVEQPDGAVRIVVSDTGPGMSDEVKSQIFEPFFTTKARGVGLGLAVTRRIVEAHGGDIEVSSVEGEGATFTITLPRMAMPRQRTDALAPSKVSP